MKVCYAVLGFLGKSTCCLLAHFQAIIQKVIEYGYPYLAKHLETYLKFLMSLYHVLIVHKYFRHIKIKSRKFWRKNLLRFGFYEKTSDGKVIIPPPHLPPLS